jgi:GMP synthase (glutamine-hydrolysing)
MEKILVIDFGGQYAHLIARRFRNLGYYSELAPSTIKKEDIKDVKGIVLSGGPSSVYDKNAPKFNSKLSLYDFKFNNNSNNLSID